jgi:hypothetical protein
MIFSDDELPDDRIYTSPEAIAAAKAEMDRLGAKMVKDQSTYISAFTGLEYPTEPFQEFRIGAYSIELSWKKYLRMNLWAMSEDIDDESIQVVGTYEFPNKSVKDAVFKALNAKGFLIQEAI